MEKVVSEHLYMGFGRGIKLDEYDDDLTPTIIIGLRIAYLFFIQRRYLIKFQIFRELVKEYRNMFSIPNVFDTIREHLGLQSDQQLYLFLHIDEFWFMIL